MKKIFIGSTLIFIKLLQAGNPTPGERVWDILALTENKAITTESKLDEVAVDFSGVFTALDVVTQKVCDDVSKLDGITISVLDTLDPLNISASKLEIVESFIDPIQSVQDGISDCLGIPIRQSDFGVMGGTTLTISTRGHYYFAEDIVFTPSFATPAIDITTSEVFLNLNGYTLSQGNTQAGVIGINIISGNQDIVITNGSISCMFGDGIRANNNTHNLTFSHLNITNIGIGTGGEILEIADGICLSGTSGSQITDVLCDNVTIVNCSDEGVDLDFTERTIFKNCTFAQNRGIGGIAFTFSSNAALVQDCLSINNQFVGFNSFSNDITFRDCKAYNNGTNGFDLDQANFNMLIDCISYGNENDGISLKNICTENCIINCTVSHNSNNGINVVDSTVDNNFFFRNTLIQNVNINVDETAGAINSYLANYAFHTGGDASNYSPGGSTINRTVINVASAFSTDPVFWRNISAIT